MTVFKSILMAALAVGVLALPATAEARMGHHWGHGHGWHHRGGDHHGWGHHRHWRHHRR
jgi:Spy/CpxP family protein refolding chaperone